PHVPRSARGQPARHGRLLAHAFSHVAPRTDPAPAPAPSPAFEELDLSLMFLGGRSRLERPEVPTPAGPRVLAKRIEAVQTGGQLPNHEDGVGIPGRGMSQSQ